MLPDDVLVEIFDFYADKNMGAAKGAKSQFIQKNIIEEWITLAHVCRRWRSVVFQSPRRLNLRLICSPRTPAIYLDLWPPLPLIIHDSVGSSSPWRGTSGVGNIIAALNHNDQVCQIRLKPSSSDLEYIVNSAPMQKPFPQLTNLWLNADRCHGPILPESFLSGTAPRLRSLTLFGITFPGLRKLLLSATHLVDLDLGYLPPSAYIPPEAMAASLATLTSLEYLRLCFVYPRPSRRPPPPPPTRSILPSLTKIIFKGGCEYLEGIFARIDAPRLSSLKMIFFNQIIFDTPELFQFISRRPTLRALEKAYVRFGYDGIVVIFPISDHRVHVEIRCMASEWQLSSLEQVCTSSLPPVSTLGDLYIFENRNDPARWQDDVENTLWLEFLRPFAAVKNLYVCKKFVPRIAPALQELVGGRTTEVLTTLENIFLEEFQPPEPHHEGIEKFVAARQLTSHPIAVSPWDGVFKL